MKRFSRVLLVSLALAGLAACAQTPQQVYVNDPGPPPPPRRGPDAKTYLESGGQYR